MKQLFRPVRAALFGGALAALGVMVCCGVVSAKSQAGAPVVQLTSAKNVSGVSPWRHTLCDSDKATDPKESWGRGEPFMAEPMVAVNPSNPRNRIIAWMDMFRGTIDAAFTVDGGKTWRPTRPIGFDSCTGNFSKPWVGTADVWLSFGPRGRAFLSAIPFTHGMSFTEVATSLDGGATWRSPVTVPNPLKSDDKDSVLADPRRPNIVYTASRTFVVGPPVGNGGKVELLFGRSENGGRQFTTHIVYQGGDTVDPLLAPQSSGLAAFTNGTLLYAYEDSMSGPTWALRSTNRGASWSARVPVSGPPTNPDIDACGSKVVLRGELSQIATFGDHVLIAYVTKAASSEFELSLARSDDQGRSWHTAHMLRSRLPIGLASVAADQSGRIGVVYDQINTSEIACPGSPRKQVIPARTVVAVSGDGGVKWQTVTVGANWWNYGAEGIMPTTGIEGYWVGDYQAIAATPDGFITATPQGPAVSGPEASGGITGDISIVAGEVTVRYGH